MVSMQTVVLMVGLLSAACASSVIVRDLSEAPREHAPSKLITVKTDDVRKAMASGMSNDELMEWLEAHASPEHQPGAMDLGERWGFGGSFAGGSFSQSSSGFELKDRVEEHTANEDHLGEDAQAAHLDPVSTPQDKAAQELDDQTAKKEDLLGDDAGMGSRRRRRRRRSRRRTTPAPTPAPVGCYDSDGNKISNLVGDCAICDDSGGYLPCSDVTFANGHSLSQCPDHLRKAQWFVKWGAGNKKGHCHRFTSHWAMNRISMFTTQFPNYDTQSAFVLTKPAVAHPQHANTNVGAIALKRLACEPDPNSDNMMCATFRFEGTGQSGHSAESLTEFVTDCVEHAFESSGENTQNDDYVCQDEGDLAKFDKFLSSL
eukprot:TRINITY_DN5520_c0_g1_i12.p1 TRINITY_DN5520_c0_g1~~TRINITY_DN5520_c0_g1_i12.p1  ORF type:complete len:373 (-),score=81.40 TRINITY_DN5520_c0_g1_i12:241-1359(-)